MMVVLAVLVVPEVMAPQQRELEARQMQRPRLLQRIQHKAQAQRSPRHRLIRQVVHLLLLHG